MQSMTSGPEADLVADTAAVLARKLPPDWNLEGPTFQDGTDARLVVRGPGGSSALFLVEIRPKFAPRDVARLTGGLSQRLRPLTGGARILVVSEYLSPRTRELLEAADIDYADLTGNVRLVANFPGLFIEARGADRDPRPRSRDVSDLRGAGAGGIVRFLADFFPPYGVSEIAEGAGVSRGYVSRVLDLLDDEALVVRQRRGVVREVDWSALLRRRAAALDLFKTNRAFSYIAESGATELLERLRLRGPQQQEVGEAVTGSFAAVRLAPIAAPSLLCIYTMEQSSRSAREFRLLEADEGGDVALLRPPNEGVFERSSVDDGIRYVAESQLAIDCLSGNGRMPAEGEAVLEWMASNERAWRRRRDG